jgi:hypothetical protein
MFDGAATTDIVIFLVVVLGRFLIPLTIPRYPLPGVLASLVLDAIDQTIFQVFTDLNLDGYQSYDKALDIYYLTITYISTMRNWTNEFAFKVSAFLFYYRLVGVALFEQLGERWLLLAFPNTFEYFFIFYEIVRLRWDPRRLTKKQLIGAAAFIWIVIKLPMEYWIHIAQMDTTDFIKEKILGASADSSWSDALSGNLWWVIPVLAVATALIWWGIRVALRRLPPADWALSFSADRHFDDTDYVTKGDEVIPVKKRFFNRELLEKAFMVSLVTFIFAMMMPGIEATPLGTAIGVFVFIVINTLLSHRMARRGRQWKSIGQEFVVTTIANFGLIVLFELLLRNSDEAFSIGNGLFFAMLFTLLITLYDRYQPVHEARFASKAAPPAA